MNKTTLIRLIYILVILNLGQTFTPHVAHAQVANHQALQAFYDQGQFTYCDAQMVAKVWKMDTFDAKIAFGKKVLNEGPSFASESMDNIRIQASGTLCPFTQSPYDFKDAQILASHWGVDVGQAKVRVEQTLADSGRKSIDASLTIAKKKQPRPPMQPDPDIRAVEAFYNQGKFTYCDARMVAKVWSMNTYEAKVTMGEKIAALGLPAAEEAMSTLRDQARRKGVRCTFGESPYQYNDVVALAALWGISVSETKVRIADKLTFNGRKFVDQALAKAKKKAPPASPHQPSPETQAVNAFYDQGQFTYCDAQMIASVWGGMDTYEAKVAFGKKILAMGVKPAQTAMADIRTKAKQKGFNCR